MTAWSRREDDTLTKLWNVGTLAAHIAMQLPGRSRDAVIGRAHRLKLREHERANNRDPLPPRRPNPHYRRVQDTVAYERASPGPCDEADKVAKWKEITGCREIKFLPGGVWTGVFRFGFTDAILIGHETDLHGYRNRWCFERGLAKAAWAAWNGEGEPIGWHRHPASGRRRPGGDPAREYVEA